MLNIFAENFLFRVAGAGFELRGVNYTLAANNGGHSLHGGAKGWDRRVWNCEVVESGVVFSRLSSDGEEVGEMSKDDKSLFQQLKHKGHVDVSLVMEH